MILDQEKLGMVKKYVFKASTGRCAMGQVYCRDRRVFT